VTVPPEVQLARSTLGLYLQVLPREFVTVEAWSSALPWARAFVLEARRLAARPILVVEDEEAFFRALAEGQPVPAAPAPLAQRRGAHVYLEGPEAFPRLFGLRREELRATWSRHAGSWAAAARTSGLRGARIRATGITPVAATRFQVEVGSWLREVLQASAVPPKRLAATAARLMTRLVHARRMTVVHANGTRLECELRLSGWTEETGRAVPIGHRPDAVWMEIPTGRLTVPVVPRTVEGRWEANRPAFDRFAENPIDTNARFVFRGGVLQEFDFERGGDRFALANPRRLRRSHPAVAVTLGLNPSVVRAPEVGDLALGAVSLQLGRPLEAGATGHGAAAYTSVLQGADVQVDGKSLLSEGRLARGQGT
jgi:hypothetical protein